MQFGACGFLQAFQCFTSHSDQKQEQVFSSFFVKWGCCTVCSPVSLLKFISCARAWTSLCVFFCTAPNRRQSVLACSLSRMDLLPPARKKRTVDENSDSVVLPQKSVFCTCSFAKQQHWLRLSKLFVARPQGHFRGKFLEKGRRARSSRKRTSGKSTLQCFAWSLSLFSLYSPPFCLSELQTYRSLWPPWTCNLSLPCVPPFCLEFEMNKKNQSSSWHHHSNTPSTHVFWLPSKQRYQRKHNTRDEDISKAILTSVDYFYLPTIKMTNRSLLLTGLSFYGQTTLSCLARKIGLPSSSNRSKFPAKDGVYVPFKFQHMPVMSSSFKRFFSEPTKQTIKERRI